jgi:alanine-glyoxylate transaminase/serine-glyoxylate transaminase/serine-pyruvate transaminase
MKSLLDSLDSVLLMGPGPSTISPKVYEVMGKNTLGHMDPQFFSVMDGLKDSLRKVMQTTNEATLTISGTGTAGMEACLVNLIEPGDPMLVIVNGYFGARMQEMASRLGAVVTTLEFPWGSPVNVEAVKKEIQEKPYRIVGMVHAETSTGVRNPIEQVGPLVAAKGAYFLVDAVTSLGGIEIKPDAWGIDAMYSCSQKCLGCPSGLSPVTFSPRAMEKITNRKTKVPNFYLDMTLLMKYWNGSPRAYHHTAPANMYYALYRALELILEEGIEAVYKRHLDAHRYLMEGLEKMGLSMLVDAPHRLPMLNTVKIPKGVEDAAVRKELRSTYKIEIGAGLGSLAGKIWRIGLMGHTARRENVDTLLGALKKILRW